MREVSCGNCIAVNATHTQEQVVYQLRAQNTFFYDSGSDGTVTLWEKEGDNAYACALTGARLPHLGTSWGPALWVTVEQFYGPMRPTTLTDVLVRHGAGLDARLRELE